MRAALVRGGMLPRLQSLAADPGRAPGTRCAGWLVYRIKSALPRPQGHGLEDHREWARACGPLEGAEQRHRRYRCSMGVHQDAEEGHRGRLRAVTTIRGGRCCPAAWRRMPPRHRRARAVALRQNAHHSFKIMRLECVQAPWGAASSAVEPQLFRSQASPAEGRAPSAIVLKDVINKPCRTSAARARARGAFSRASLRGRGASPLPAFSCCI